MAIEDPGLGRAGNGSEYFSSRQFKRQNKQTDEKKHLVTRNHGESAINLRPISPKMAAAHPAPVGFLHHPRIVSYAAFH
jgi:hypothetical protein